MWGPSPQEPPQLTPTFLTIPSLAGGRALGWLPHDHGRGQPLWALSGCGQEWQGCAEGARVALWGLDSWAVARCCVGQGGQQALGQAEALREPVGQVLHVLVSFWFQGPCVVCLKGWSYREGKRERSSIYWSLSHRAFSGQS